MLCVELMLWICYRWTHTSCSSILWHYGKITAFSSIILYVDMTSVVVEEMHMHCKWYGLSQPSSYYIFCILGRCWNPTSKSKQCIYWSIRTTGRCQSHYKCFTEIMSGSQIIKLFMFTLYANSFQKDPWMTFKHATSCPKHTSIPPFDFLPWSI